MSEAASSPTPIELVKSDRRRMRLRSDDPRVLAGGVRDELVSMLRDNGVPVSRSAGLGELGAVVESTLGRGAVEIVGTLARARFGPPSGAQSAAVESVALLDGLRRTLARRLGTGGRVRAALSAASLRRA